ncbi:hypothetical protein [Nocardia jiangxiensis]|uniref:hypothetical protein n=1 Tax=Nocardia jiangxiensis TaxID=282685 RepID=UPI000593512F|nr:hypothetical protein [Nocardia jiangxiensis]
MQRLGAFGEIGSGESEFGAAVVHGLGQCHGELDLAAGLGDVLGFGVALGEFVFLEGLFQRAWFIGPAPLSRSFG